jgi:hypothetical protein
MHSGSTPALPSFVRFLVLIPSVSLVVSRSKLQGVHGNYPLITFESSIPHEGGFNFNFTTSSWLAGVGFSLESLATVTHRSNKALAHTCLTMQCR